MKSISFYNTFSGKKEVFEPKNDEKVNFYTCGPTVYNFIHIGNARPYVVFDVARKYLEKKGYDVNYIVNVTDIEDKIINKANNENIPFNEVSEKYEKEFLKDLEYLQVKLPDNMPRATDTIDDMINLIKKLEKKGYTYETSDGVYYRVRKFKDYGKLSNKNIDELKSGERVAVNSEKEDPLDFVLWKFSKPNEPSWDSPWGKGRPGWHIECSTMSLKYAGGTLDIHAGGEDLIFPHHENEIAQAEAATGEKFVRYWLHNAYVNIDGIKMSKSLGNFKTVRELSKKYSSEVIRLFLLSTHYRKLLNFTDNTIENAVKKSERIKNFLLKIENIGPVKNDFFKKYNKELKENLNNDLNTPGAIGVLMDAIKKANKNKDNENILSGAKALIYDWNEIFSIIPEEKEIETEEEDLINLLIKIRKIEKENKNYEIADLIRDELEQLNIVLEDTPKGTRYKKK